MPHTTHTSRIRLWAVALGIFAVLAVPASAAITYVKKVEAVVVASSNAVSSGNFASAVATGNLIVVRIWFNDPARSVLSVTDSKGNTYARVAGPTTGPSGMTGWRQELWYGKNVTGGTGFSVTATFDASFSTEKSISAYEYAGADPVAPLDAAAATTTTSANASSGSVVTGTAAELIVGAALFGNCGNAGSGYSLRSSLNCNAVEDKAVTTAGSYAATFSNSAQAAIVQLATFKAAGQAADTTPPTTPAALSATAASSSQINLSWTASTDNVGVASYRVYRNSAQIATATGTTYSDSGLAAATTYTYAVAAVDAAGNVSGLSTSANATTAAATDTTPPSTPTGLSASAVSSSAITLTWTASTDNVAVAAYNVYRGSVLAASVTTTGYADTGLAASTAYTYSVAAVDTSGNVSARSTTASATTLAPVDTSAPTVPASLTASALSASAVALAWSASADNVAVAGYKVFRGSTQVSTTTGTTFVDSGLAASTSYTYNVAAFDAAGNTSALSSPATATTQAPPAVSYSTAFLLTENPISENGRWIDGKTIGLDWADVSTTPGLAIGQQSGTSGYDDATAVLTGFWGNDQAAEATVYTTAQDSSIFEELELRLRTSITPHSITGYEINFSARSDSSAYAQIVRWNGPLGSWTLLDSRGGVQYAIKTGDVVRATVVGNVITAYINGVQVLRVTDNGVSAGGSPGIGFFLQSATGVNGNYGFTSFTATSNAPVDTQAPSVPAGLAATAASTSEIDLSWLPASDNVGTAGYTVYRNGAAVATVTGTTFASVGLTPSTAYTFAVSASDAAGNASALSVPLTISTLTPPDTSAPTAPSGLTAAAQGPSAMTLTWGPSIDNVGVAGYRVFRGGVAVANVTTGTSYTDSGLNASTAYRYQVAAYDAAGNVSPLSATASATTTGAAFDGGSINAASCASPDVQAAIDAAADGFTVLVPAGACVWTVAPGGAAIGIAGKSITIQGAGVDQTTIFVDVAGGAAAMLHADIGGGKSVRVTGFTLSTASSALELVAVTGASTNLRIDHTRFDAAAGATALHVAGAIYGVVDHNTFHNAGAVVEDEGDGSWQRPLNLGGADALYFEDNVFQFDVPGAAMGGRGGGRYVFRHNSSNAGIQDGNSCDAGLRGARRFEIYSNTFNADTFAPAAPIALRGGTGVVFGNTIGGTFGTMTIVADDPRSDATICAGIWAAHPVCDGSAPYDGNAPGSSGYLCRDQIGASTDAGFSTPQSADPVYAWSNASAAGDAVPMVAGGGAGSRMHVQENRDFFNVARPDYAPYAYPHPLVLSGPDLIAPTISITSPQSGAAVTGIVAVSASASDNVAVASVSLAVDGVPLGAPLVAAPYTALWNAGAAAVGPHTLTATAVDAAGNIGLSSAVVVYVPDTTPPVIAGPAEAATSATGTTITWSTDEPSDSQVTFASGPCPSGTLCTWPLAPALVTSHAVPITGLTPSTTYTYSVKSKDAAGNLATSLPRAFTTPADTTAPSIAISSPTGGTVAGASVQVTATASDDVGVIGVQFRLDGAALGVEATASPWTIAWDTTQAANGPHVLTAAARDAAGNVTLSTGISVTVNNDVTPPAVTLTAPANNASVTGTISVTATAGDNVGVVGVKFSVDGTAIGAEDAAAPYSISWNTTGIANGVHVVTAAARDAAGNVAVSSATVTVANPITYHPSSYSVTTGTYQSGSASSVAADDNSYLVVKSTTSGTSRQTVTAFTVTSAVSGSRVDYSVRLKSNTSSTSVVVYAMNYTTGAWTQLTTGTVGSSETTLTARLTSGIASYVNASGQMSVRVQTTSGSTTHSASIELVQVVVTP